MNRAGLCSLRASCFVVLVLTGCDFFKTKYHEIPPEFPETITVLNAADLSWEFRDLDGDTMSLQQFAGKRMFINVWATWCQPCRLEFPKLQELYDAKRSDTTIVFLFISDEPDPVVRAFADTSSYTLPLFVSDTTMPAMWRTGTYPTTFIVDSRGNLVYQLSLTADWSHPSVGEFLKRVE